MSRDVVGVFAVGARVAGLRVFEAIDKLADKADHAGVRLGLKDAAFMKAIQAGDTAQARALLAAGVNPLAPRVTRDGWSPVHETAQRGDLKMLAVLESHVHAHPEHAAIFNTGELHEHRTPFQVAIDSGNHAFAARLISAGHAHLASVDREGRNGLSRLSYGGHIDMLRQAINVHGPAFVVEHAMSAQMPVQHEAVLGGTPNRIAVISLLQELGLDVFLRNGPDGGSLVHSAANVGDGEVLAHLLDQKKVDVDAPNRHGMTALHILAAHGRHSLAQDLLDRGANPNATSIHDPARSLVEATPLMLAAARGHRNTVDVIANDPRTRIGMTSQSSGLHAVDYARRNGHADVAAAMEDGMRRRVAANSSLENHARFSFLPQATSPSAAPRPGRRP